jgi:secondary thiamine-phosphate synthase enzyme
VHRKTLIIKTGSREEFLDITAKVREFIRSTGVERGCLVVFVPHTTAAVTINEGADPSVIKDLRNALHRLVPYGDRGYGHREGNSDAHIKASLLGSSLHLLVEGRELLLGTWQSIFFAEFDGPRQRQVWLSLVF